MKLFILILVFYMVFYDKLNNKGKNMNNINCLFVMLFLSIYNNKLSQIM